MILLIFPLLQAVLGLVAAFSGDPVMGGLTILAAGCNARALVFGLEDLMGEAVIFWMAGFVVGVVVPALL